MSKEILLSVREGCNAYKGIATSIPLAGQQVVIMAKSVNALNIIYNKYFPNETLRLGLCYEVVLTAAAYATLDEV